MIKAVIYDMDDLMVNSYSLHAEVDQQFVKKFNHDLSELTEELKVKFVGMRVIDICNELVRIFNLDIDPKDFFNKRNELFLEIARTKLKAMPGLVESLRLFKANNFSLALASSAVKPYINLVLDKFNIRNYFNAIVSGDDVDNGKPHPETYLTAAQKLGLKYIETLKLLKEANFLVSGKVLLAASLLLKITRLPSITGDSIINFSPTTSFGKTACCL